MRIMKIFIVAMQNHRTYFCHVLLMRSSVTPKAVLDHACPISVPHDVILMTMCMCLSHSPVWLTYPLAYSQDIRISFTKRTSCVRDAC